MPTCSAAVLVFSSALLQFAVELSRCQDLDLSIASGSQRVDLSFVGEESMLNVRHIQLANGDYRVRCSTKGNDGFRNDTVWFKGSNPIFTDNHDSALRVYAFMENARTWQLHIRNYTSQDNGLYACRDGMESLSLNISYGNPTVVPSTPFLTLKEGSQGSNRPSLRSLVTGNPFPTMDQENWGIDGNSTLPTKFVRLTVGELLLGNSIDIDDKGIYNHSVTTSAGTAFALIVLTVVVDPAVIIDPSSELEVVTNRDIVLTCMDSTGMPASTISWQFGDDPLMHESPLFGSSVSISTMQISNRSRSVLTVSSVNSNHTGTYKCVAVNSPLTFPSQQSVNVFVLLPPAPPSNFTVSHTSACMADINFIPQFSDSFSRPDSFTVDVQILDGGVPGPWVTVGNGSTPPLAVNIPFLEIDTMYNVRGQGVNSIAGSGMPSGAYGPFVGYQTGDIPTVTLRARPAGSYSINVSLLVSDTSCFQFNFTVICRSEGQSESKVNVTFKEVGLNVTVNVTVANLEASTVYNCFTSAHPIGRVLSEGYEGVEPVFSNGSKSFTFPRAPSTKPNKPLVDSFSSETFTVTLHRLLSGEDISHYQVLVLRLASGSVPSEHPDRMYPDNTTFSTCDQVNNRTTEGRVFQPYVAAEMSASEFREKFVVGDGKRGDEFRCNSKLVPGTPYTVFLRGFPVTLSPDGERQYSVFSSSSYTDVVFTKASSEGLSSSGDDVAVIVIVTILVVLFVVVIPILLFIGVIYWLRSKKRNTSNSFTPSVDSSMSDLRYTPDNPDSAGENGIELKKMEAFSDPIDLPFQPSSSIHREDFAAHVEKFDAKRQLKFQEEFEWISKNSPWHSAEASMDVRNEKKNRYSNITAFDHSCVKLTLIPGVECSDYINANYISGYSRPQEYIATQGPLDQTVEDFWRMVWEEKTTTIIMLTNLVELGKTKCSQYWPSSSKAMYGKVSVTLENTHVFPNYTIRTLAVQMNPNNEVRRVLQFHYTKWPDYGTPKLAAPLLNFLKIVHESNDSEDAGPMVVHCSAGVGRTGTVLTIDYCLQQLKNEDKVNICGFVHHMREQRNYMVQTDQQYTFIHYAILEAICYGDTSFEVDKFIEFYSTIQKEHSGVLLQDEFDRLGAVKTMVKKSSFENRLQIKGAPQRHFHSSFHGGSPSSSLQQCLGHFLDGYNETKMFVLTEGPDDMTASRFWDIVWHQNCTFIIMLTPRDSEDFFCYWPSNGSKEVEFGTIRVTVEEESFEHLYTRRKIRLTNTKVESISHELVHYEFMGWTTQNLPRIPDFVGFICDVLKQVYMEKSCRILVHDTSSLDPSGIFCSLYYCIQRLRIEKMVDVFQAVQMVRLQRPGCVSSLREYAFIYDSVNEFLVKNS